MKISVEEKIKRDWIIFNKYFPGETVRLDMCCPFPGEEEDNPSFSIYEDDNGRLKWSKFNSSEFGDMVMFIARMEKVSIKQAAREYYTADVGDGSKVVARKVRPKLIPHLKVRNYYSKATLDYWEQYGIDQQMLIDLDIYELETLHWGKYLSDEYEDAFPAVVYLYPWAIKPPDYSIPWKLYRPLNPPKTKWKQHLVSDILGNWNRIDPTKGDTYTIVTSLKDGAVYEVITGDPNWGYTGGEGAVKPILENLTEIKELFPKQRIIQDLDPTGVGQEMAAKLSNLTDIPVYQGITYYGIGAKDISDSYKKYKLKHLKPLLK